ncbi:hypothetical protein FDP41_003801 [Naegleria fowleri]|uniref:Alpha/beta hydrolase fold-3 domain-containing protein n=1 Tax=Naegleria fowleri TaxID=5763 RepID=A0A6A5BT02_NAEFO|nr:uncharacterized protein FDP41_003801 [Naegleria fowleri]KAF0977148.1 hypothetical protein FDP41_003801 [Naegleria fowleri]
MPDFGTNSHNYHHNQNRNHSHLLHHPHSTDSLPSLHSPHEHSEELLHKPFFSIHPQRHDHPTSPHQGLRLDSDDLTTADVDIPTLLITPPQEDNSSLSTNNNINITNNNYTSANANKNISNKSNWATNAFKTLHSRFLSNPLRKSTSMFKFPSNVVFSEQEESEGKNHRTKTKKQGSTYRHHLSPTTRLERHHHHYQPPPSPATMGTEQQEDNFDQKMSSHSSPSSREALEENSAISREVSPPSLQGGLKEVNIGDVVEGNNVIMGDSDRIESSLAESKPAMMNYKNGSEDDMTRLGDQMMQKLMMKDETVPQNTQQFVDSFFMVDKDMKLPSSKLSVDEESEELLKDKMNKPSGVDDMYGLDIYYHNNRDLCKIEGPEDRFTLIDIALETAMTIQKLFQNEAKRYENNVSNGKIYLFLKMLLEVSKDLEVNLKHMKSRIVQIELKLAEKFPNQFKFENQTCIAHNDKMASFDLSFLDTSFHFRGCFLILIHTLNECKLSINKVIQSRNSFFLFTTSDAKYEKKLDVFQQKFLVLKTMFNVSNMLLQERLDSIDSNNPSYIPFSQSLKISDMDILKDINPIVFWQHIGTFYDSEIAWFLSLIVKTTASFGHTQEVPSKLKKDLIFYAASAYYLINPKSAAENCATLFNNNPIASSEFWNIQDENNIIKTFTYLGYPFIETSRKFKIPFPGRKIVDSVGLNIDGDEFEFVSVSKEAPEDSSIILFNNNNEQSEKSNSVVYYSEDDDDDGEEESIDQNATPVEYRAGSSMIYPQLDNLEEVKEGSSSLEVNLAEIQKKMKNHDYQDIALRIISTKPLTEVPDYIAHNPQDFPYLSQILKAINSIKLKQVQHNTTFDGKVILHIHGGGFIAMQSFSHEVYLRKWCSATNMPIISVDYRRSPQYKYPTQVEECYSAYKWLLSNCEKLLGAPLKKFVIAGDSAGGNLALATIYRAIRDDIRLPDAVVLSYPATYLDFNPSPSRQISVIDPLVNINFLRLCGELYCVESDNARCNPFVSPSTIEDGYLKRFPPTYFNFGTLDPLFDDAVYMAKKISRNNGGRVKIKLYDSLGHGYLNMIDVSGVARLASAHICEWISNQVEK